MQWSETFSGFATITVNGISGSCESEESTLEVEVILNISDIVISGNNSVCINSRVIYNLNRDAVDYTWQVDDGANIIEFGPNHALVEWTQTGDKVLSIVEQATSGCPSQATSQIIVNSSTAPTIPIIHRKGDINILICTTHLMEYKWFINNGVLDSQTKQYYVARNNLGSYNVQITNTNQCPNTSEAYNLDTYANAQSQVSVYPNPTSGEFTIEAECEALGDTRIVISDTFGKVIYSENFAKTDVFLSKRISNLHLTKGFYIISLIVENQTPMTTKLTIF
jgi:hypothetical protein